LRVGRGEFSVHELGTFILSEALGDAGDAGPYLVTLEMDATDRPNLLRDACQVVADDNVNLHGAWGRGGQESGLALVHLSLDAPTLDHVVRIAHRLAHMPGTLRVRRAPNDVNPTCTL
jgi:(p)ppGpp synthase/HD superfamily hydrolase